VVGKSIQGGIMGKPGLVRISGEQMQLIHKIQEQERDKSPLGVTPSVNSIARALIEKGIGQLINSGKSQLA